MKYEKETFVDILVKMMRPIRKFSHWLLDRFLKKIYTLQSRSNLVSYSTSQQPTNLEEKYRIFFV